jgi:osomolarity two-component system sensor histidine kinase NIK1
MINIQELRILVVDDYEINRQVLAMALKRLDMKAIMTNDGKSAVDEYINNPFHIVFMDLMMPIMDGFEATENIRKFEKEHNLSPALIIAVSANILDEKRKDILKQGFNDILAKPFVLNDLVELLSKHLAL